MAQKGLYSLSILYDKKAILDDISLLHVANEFVDHHSDQKNTFGIFTEKDLQIFVCVLFLIICYFF